MWHLLSAPLKSCWKVGNARLYNATLYGHLATSIPLLVANLRDSDPKTRANAAGALGNLARNGSRLCAELMKSGAPAALLAVALTVLSPPAAVPDLSAARTALFSLGRPPLWGMPCIGVKTPTSLCLCDIMACLRIGVCSLHVRLNAGKIYLAVYAIFPR